MPSCLALDIREWSGNVKHMELPVDQPAAVAFIAFADVWPRATETEIGTALCVIGAGMTLTFLYVHGIILCSYVLFARPNDDLYLFDFSFYSSKECVSYCYFSNKYQINVDPTICNQWHSI